MNGDDDPFVAALMEAMEKPIDEEWPKFLAEYGTGPSVVFEGGFGIPSALDCVRYGLYKEKGLEALLAWDEGWRAYAQGIRDGTITPSLLSIPENLPNED